MPGNTIGKAFRVTTWGESHGAAIGCVIDGCPPGLPLGEDDIQPDLERRRPGKTRHTTQRRETDEVRILSGVFEGATTGTPIQLVIENVDQRPRDYSRIKDVYRPSHADYTYHHKYGVRDYRGGGRASARETAMRVAAGAVAKKYLRERAGIEVRGHLAQLGPIRPASFDWDEVERNPFFCPDAEAAEEMARFMDALRKSGDSIGARIDVVATGVPPGLGEPVFDRLDADLARALMSINAVKGVEIGAGFGVVEMRGTENRDEITPEGFVRNNAGGILGGISSGQDIRASIALKPTSSIRPSRAKRRHRGKPGRGGHPRPPRPLRRHPGDPDRGGHGRHRADGPLAAPPGGRTRRWSRRRRGSRPRRTDLPWERGRPALGGLISPGSAGVSPSAD